jgi:two-component system, OmpR family, alkaline phosphatase synthesis response regulator PhoP
MRILIVDDEPQYRLLLRNVLQDEGYEVFDAADGDEAMTKMSRVKVDMIISDVYMPIMDGVKLHRTVREIPGYEKLPFLFVSAYDDHHTQEAVKNPRCEGFLRKGKPVHLLLAWVSYLLTPEERRASHPPIDDGLGHRSSETGKGRTL